MTKRILALVLVVGMLFTMTPMSIFAQSVLATAKTDQATYSAGVGETISVPFRIVPTSESIEMGALSADIKIPEGLEYTITDGIATTSNAEFSPFDGGFNVWMENATTLTASNNIICTVNFTASQEGDYVVGFDPEVVDILDSGLNPLAAAFDGQITVSGATLSFGSGDTGSIIANSTLVKMQNFDSGAFTKGGEISGTIEDMSAFTGQANLSATTPEVSTGNLALKLSRLASDTSTYAYRATWNADTVIDRPYFVISYKSKSNSKADAVDMRFYYDNLTSGELVPDSDKGTYTDAEDKAGLPLYFKYNKIERDSPYNGSSAVGQEGCTNFKWLTDNQYLDGNWREYSYLIDAVNRKAYLYIDGAYVMSFVIVYNRGSSYAGDNGKFIEGLSRIQFYPTKWDGAYNSSNKETYIDDLQIRTMSDEQFARFMTGEVEFTADVVENEDKLLTETKTFKFPVKWTTDNDDVKVLSDGTVIAGAAAHGKTVTFTATVNGIAIATHTATIDSLQEVTTTSTPVFIENFNYGSTYLTTDASPDASKELRTLKPDGFTATGSTSSSTSGKKFWLVSNPDSQDATDGVLKIQNEIQVTNNYDYSEVNRYITSDANTRYVVYSQKVKMSSTSVRMAFFTSHKAKVDGGINPDKSATATQDTSNKRVAFLLDGRSSTNPIKGGASGDNAISSNPTLGQFIGRWVDMVIIFDALDWKYTLYVDGIKVNTNPQSVSTTGVDTSKTTSMV